MVLYFILSGIRLNKLYEILNNMTDIQLNEWACDCLFNHIVSNYDIYELYNKPLYYYRYHVLKPTKYIYK